MGRTPTKPPIRTPLTPMTAPKVAAPKVLSTNTVINTDHRLSAAPRQPVYTKSVITMKVTQKQERPQRIGGKSAISMTPKVQNTTPRPMPSVIPSNHIVTQHKERVSERRPFQLRATASEWNGYGYPQNNGLWISTPIQKPVPISNTNSVPQHGWNGGSYQMMNTPSIWTVNATNPNTGMASSYSGDIWNDMNIAKDIDRFVVNDGSSISSRSALSAETPNEDIF